MKLLSDFVVQKRKARDRIDSIAEKVIVASDKGNLLVNQLR